MYSLFEHGIVLFFMFTILFSFFFRKHAQKKTLQM